MEIELSKIKEFEATLKRIILETYGKFLPENKVTLLNVTNYATNDLMDSENESEIKGKLLNRMLNDLIDINTIKSITLEDGNTLNIYYGMSLEESLINYYSYELSSKYNIDIYQIEGLREDLETIKALYDKMGESLMYSSFNEDAVKLLTKADIKEITEKYDQEELENYFKKVIKVAGMPNVSKEEQNNIMKESTDRQLSVQIVWLQDKKYIKYVDKYGEVHLTNIDNAPSVEEFYQKKLASLGPDEKLDSDEFYHELIKYYTEELALHKTDDVKEDELTSKQVNMLEFIKTTPELENARVQDIMKHNNDMDIHVMNYDKSIVTTEDKDGYVESNIVKDGSAYASETNTQTDRDISSQLISKEEYIRLNNKLFSGEELSKEELEALRRAASVYAEEVFDDMKNGESEMEGGVPLKPKDPYNSGFTIKTFALYFVVLTIFIATVIGIIILR